MVEESAKFQGSAPVHVPLKPGDLMAIMFLDLACHSLAGMANQLGGALKMTEPAAELTRTVRQLQEYRHRYFLATQSKIQVVGAAGLPRP